MKDYPGPIDGLHVSRDNGVLALRLDRPDRLNAITDEMLLGLIDHLEAAGSDEEIRVIHLSGAGANFCSGFDMSLRGGEGEKPRIGATQRRMRWHVNRLLPALLETQTPIVTTVSGWAIGLGMNVALASDFVIAADDARFWAPFTQAGFTPDSGASWLLPRLVGTARAREIIMLAPKISGAQAEAWGMIHRAVPLDQVEAETEALLAQLAASATVAVGLSKLLINRSLEVDLNRQLQDEGLAMEVSSRSQDFHEASRAKRENRDVKFTGT
jgi:2-(1,2-epoxy-1,2-dihydrophenyl)acetyl-CoA isomerase